MGHSMVTTHETIESLTQVEDLLETGDLLGAQRALNHYRPRNDDAQAYTLMSQLLRLRGRADQARALLDVYCVHYPSTRAMEIERARVALSLGDLKAADEAFAHASVEDAFDEDWVQEWIEVSSQLGHHANAIRLALMRCQHKPGEATRWFALGLVYQRARMHQQALDAYAEVAQRDPHAPMLHNNIGAAHLELKAYASAQHELGLALRLDPGNALAWTNLATAALKQGKLDDALVAVERACALAPNYPTALQTYSYVLKECQQWQAALHVAQRALSLEPSNASMMWSVAMLELLLGDYSNGWLHHEARWAGSPELRDVAPNLPMPRWQGEPLAGKTLFVWGEQGHGDVFQFVRFVPALAERVEREGGSLIYSGFQHLQTLLARSLHGVVDTVVPHDQAELPRADFHLPLASIPFMQGITPEQLPVRTNYLRANPAKLDAWRRRLQKASSALKVGLVWSGSRSHQRNALRSVPPQALAQVFASAQAIEWFSLQLDAAEDVAALRAGGMTLVDVSEELHSFDDTAAIIANLDLVITVCTSVAHLAAAMGRPTWVLLDVNPHWVWMTERRDSPWYPSVTLYRQADYGDWTPVLEQVVKDLSALAVKRGPVPDYSPKRTSKGNSNDASTTRRAREST